MRSATRYRDSIRCVRRIAASQFIYPDHRIQHTGTHLPHPETPTNLPHKRSSQRRRPTQQHKRAYTHPQHSRIPRKRHRTRVPPGPRPAPRPIPHPAQRRTSREILPPQKHAHRDRILQMNAMQHARRQRRIVRTEDNREIEGAGPSATHRRDRGAVEIAVETDVVGSRDGQRGEGVDLDVGALRRLAVERDGFDDVRARDVVGARCADGVVGPGECDG